MDGFVLFLDFIIGLVALICFLALCIRVGNIERNVGRNGADHTRYLAAMSVNIAKLASGRFDAVDRSKMN